MGNCGGAEESKSILRDYFCLPSDRLQAVLRKKAAKGAVELNKPVNMYGDTLLHFCVYHGDKGSTQLLVKSGADVNIKNTFGFTPLDIAKKCNKEMEAYLQELCPNIASS